MKQFFLDIVSPHACSYDYHGNNYSSSESAARAAELLALDLACSETHVWIGTKVQVRTATGDTFCSVPVVMAA
jgi:hypothetical protein